MHLIYPRKASKANPFLADLVASLESRGNRVASFLPRGLVPSRSTTIILNWAENLWSDAPDNWAKKMTKSVGTRLLPFLLKAQAARGAKIVMIVHNAYPHEDSRGSSFWKVSPSFLASVQHFVHFTEASRSLYVDQLGIRGHSIVHPFPQKMENHAYYSEVKLGQPKLLFIGADQERKQLHQLLDPIFRPTGFVLLASGFANEEEFRSRYGFDRKIRASEVTWLGRRLSSEQLENCLRLSSILVLNQRGQLNSGLMWMAISRGLRVLAPETPAFLELAPRLGPSWLRLFPPLIEPPVFQALVHEFLNSPSTPPPKPPSFLSFAEAINSLGNE